MTRKGEFKEATAKPLQQKGGIRNYARATKDWVERQPARFNTVETHTRPGRGQNGESSN